MTFIVSEFSSLRRELAQGTKVKVPYPHPPTIKVECWFLVRLSAKIYVSALHAWLLSQKLHALSHSPAVQFSSVWITEGNKLVIHPVL